MVYQLRPYQQDAVDATLKHFRQTDDPAVIVLPTGAGKSLVIAELAKIARGKLLILAHVKELVEQNHEKYQSYGLTAGIYSAGLQQKNRQHQITFASIQSVARNLDDFNDEYSLVIVDECHRVSHSHHNVDSDDPSTSQYYLLLKQLRTVNPRLKLLGLTATPYRMGLGWVYRHHYHGFLRAQQPRPFERCIYELPLRYMIKNGFLTEPKIIDAAISQYDFSQLKTSASGAYSSTEMNSLLAKHPRVTESIVEQVVMLAQQHRRQGVMIFAATVEHAKEICGYLAAFNPALITGQTASDERERLITAFKCREIVYLVNVSVLTTGFDAPHVDMIALLRPTASVSLFQQIVGRGLRLSEGKNDCLVIDYAANGFDLFYPEVGEKKPSSDSVPVMVSCPCCDFANTFWGKQDDEGHIIEHYGRRCWGMEEDEKGEVTACDYRFRFKQCNSCGAENDIAARSCRQCGEAIVDPDNKLKDALRLRDYRVIRCAGATFSEQDGRLKIVYYDEDGTELSESFDFSNRGQRAVFNQLFGRRFNQGVEPLIFATHQQVVERSVFFTAPDFVIAKKKGNFWRIQEKIFDYHGAYRQANQLQ
ncbi:Putative DNA repair helicase RadD [Sinobacterium norvegicum]|uniref:DNA repair helicase RadD n=1 Tax=Sinobacterium norvegicum TaxID=1641715 RepID=A0ABM9AHA5_9GAMM|nr:DEAD/DEAH box helicase [Sinobacterium norvegicum]CAH0992605.1 Putative DNA repair helicase RadD [Sinobacterium norvegicum]